MLPGTAATPGLDREGMFISEVLQYRSDNPQRNPHIRYMDFKSKSKVEGTSCSGLDFLDPALYDDHTIRAARRLRDIANGDTYVELRAFTTVSDLAKDEEKQPEENVEAKSEPEADDGKDGKDDKDKPKNKAKQRKKPYVPKEPKLPSKSNLVKFKEELLKTDVPFPFHAYMSADKKHPLVAKTQQHSRRDVNNKFALRRIGCRAHSKTVAEGVIKLGYGVRLQHMFEFERFIGFNPQNIHHIALKLISDKDVIGFIMAKTNDITDDQGLITCLPKSQQEVFQIEFKDPEQAYEVKKLTTIRIINMYNRKMSFTVKCIKSPDDVTSLLSPPEKDYRWMSISKLTVRQDTRIADIRCLPTTYSARIRHFGDGVNFS